MTIEELEKEAEEWLDDERKYIIEDTEGNLINISKKVKEAYLAGAEPREKRIAELEKENAELKTRNQELLQSCEGATMMYKDLQRATKIIKKYLAIGVGGKITQNYLDVTKEAEQFLKEE